MSLVANSLLAELMNAIRSARLRPEVTLSGFCCYTTRDASIKG